MRPAAAALLLAACRPPTAPAAPALPPAPRGADLIYFVMVDRFADGSPDPPGSTDPADPHGWHGGDLEGLRARLPHLAQLGVGTVWLSPISRSRTDKIDEWGAFHGYWVHELGAVEPRFGDAAALARLADALHARGMRLVLDVVWNHVGPGSPLLQAQPGWFHGAGDIVDWADPEQRVRGDVHGLPDLAQELPEVEDHLLHSTLALMAGGADGLRIDAVGHMPLPALARLNDRLDAARPGGVWTLAEDFTGDPLTLRRTVEDGHFDAIFDFSLRYALIDAACKGQPARLASTLELDRLWAGPGQPPGQEAPQLVTFLDNHDTERLMTACGGDEAKADAALLLLFALRGTPSLTWGTEALLPGAREPETRASMPWGAEGRRAGAIAALQAARAAHPSLRASGGRPLSLGGDHLLWAQQAPPAAPDEAGELSLILLSTRSGSVSLPLPPGLEGATLLAALGPGAGPSGGPAPASVSLSGPGAGAWVLRPPAGFTLGSSALEAFPIEAWAPSGPGDRLVLVGAAPELGAWSAAAGLELSPPSAPGGPWTGVAALPAGGVPAFKLARLPAAGGPAEFEPGADRSPLLPATPAPLRLRWGSPAGARD